MKALAPRSVPLLVVVFSSGMPSISLPNRTRLMNSWKKTRRPVHLLSQILPKTNNPNLVADCSRGFFDFTNDEINCLGGSVACRIDDQMLSVPRMIIQFSYFLP